MITKGSISREGVLIVKLGEIYVEVAACFRLDELAPETDQHFHTLGPRHARLFAHEQRHRFVKRRAFWLAPGVVVGAAVLDLEDRANDVAHLGYGEGANGLGLPVLDIIPDS